MLRKALRIAVVVFGIFVVVSAALLVRARSIVERSYAALPEPAIHADGSEQGRARGELLFQSLCVECHGGADGRATGKRLDEIPAFLGSFWSANLAHPTQGVHARSDGQLARVLRNGVLPDGRLSVVMNGFGALGDADVAALIGYMRSQPPALRPGGRAQPRSQVSWIGAAIITYVAKLRVDAPAAGVPVPPKAPDVAYGRYMATVLDCVTCHTEGFGPDKLSDPNAFAGGFELTDPTGATIFTRNITFDESTGIGRWSVDDFQRALTRGVRPDGFLVRKPMPLFARLDRTDVEALYAFLRSVPKVRRENLPGGHPLAKAHANDTAGVLFGKLGCVACHGEGAPYRDELRAALGKTDADVASWILDPQALRPGSPMPSFAGAIDRAQAEQLAKYAKQLAAERASASAGAASRDGV